MFGSMGGGGLDSDEVSIFNEFYFSHNYSRGKSCSLRKDVVLRRHHWGLKELSVSRVLLSNQKRREISLLHQHGTINISHDVMLLKSKMARCYVR